MLPTSFVYSKETRSKMYHLSLYQRIAPRKNLADRVYNRKKRTIHQLNRLKFLKVCQRFVCIVFSSTLKRGKRDENVNKVQSGTLSFTSVVCPAEIGFTLICQTGQHTSCLLSDSQRHSQSFVQVCVCV